MRKNRKKIGLNRETLQALTVDASGLRGVAGGFPSIRTCGTPCSNACTTPCSDPCSNLRTFCC